MTQTQVSGSGIKNNVVTNSHLHSAANIASSKLADSGVTAGSYGSGSATLSLTINSKGIITAASTNAITQVGGSNGVDFNDNVKARFGSGNDLEIFHNSNDSIINDSGTGDLKFQVGGSTKFQSYSVSGETGGLKLDGTVLKFEGISQSSNQPNVNTGNPSMMWVFDEELNIAGYGKISFIEQGFKRWTINNGALHPHGTTYNNLGNTSNRVGNAYIQTSVDLIDNAKLLLGSSDDLEIFHNGISNVFGTSNGNIELVAGSEYLAKFIPNGAVELYHDNTKRFETDSNGVRVVAPEGEQAMLRLIGDEGDDNNDYFRLNAGGGTLKIQDASNGSSWEDNIVINAGASVELYHDNDKKFETRSNGIMAMGSSGDVAVNIKVPDTISQSRIIFSDATNTDGIITYDHNDRKMHLGAGTASATDGDLTIDSSGNVSIPNDNGKLQLGTSADLKIYHSGSHSHIQDAGTGNLRIQTNNLRIENAAGTENQALFTENGAVELYYDNSIKLTTTSNGVDFGSAGADHVLAISGQTVHRMGSQGSGIHFSSNVIVPTNSSGTNVNNTVDLGNSSYRWRNIYTNDLHLSNEGGKNDIDSTWGSFTIQEGAESLFLINRRNGKKYKFNLTEVS